MLAGWRAVANNDSPQGEKARLNLAKAPKLTAYEEDFYRAFYELATERSIGMAPGPIPRSAILEMARGEGMGPTDEMIFMRVIRAMDNAYLIASAAKRSKDSPK